MLRFLLFMFLGYVALRTVRHLMLPAGKQPLKPNDGHKGAIELQACPVCGAYGAEPCDCGNK